MNSMIAYAFPAPKTVTKMITANLVAFLVLLENALGNTNRDVMINDSVKKIVGTRIYSKPDNDSEVGDHVCPLSLPSQSASLPCSMA